jgi:hypothetical protein
MRNITAAALASAPILFAGTAVAQQNVDFSKVGKPAHRRRLPAVHYRCLMLD